MKKFLISLMITATVTGMIILPQQSEAADFSVSLYSYYTWWIPAWRGAFSDGLEFEPDLLWGPAFSMTFFEKFTLGLVVLQNNMTGYDATWKESGTGPNGEYYTKFSGKIYRTDMDFSLSYSINRIFKGFAGLKYFSFSPTDEITKERYYEGQGKDTISENGGFDYEGLGSAAGLSVTLPLINNTYITFNNSLVYFFYNQFFTIVNVPPTTEYNMYDKNDPVEPSGSAYGVNSTLAVSYYIDAISSSISLGGRFQYLRYSIDTDKFDIKDDIIYGITAGLNFFF